MSYVVFLTQPNTVLKGLLYVYRAITFVSSACKMHTHILARTNGPNRFLLVRKVQTKELKLRTRLYFPPHPYKITQFFPSEDTFTPNATLTVIFLVSIHRRTMMLAMKPQSQPIAELIFLVRMQSLLSPSTHAGRLFHFVGSTTGMFTSKPSSPFPSTSPQ